MTPRSSLATKGLAGGCLVLSLLIAGCGNWPQPTTQPTPTPTPSSTSTEPELAITLPLENSKVEQTEMVRGTSRNIPTGQVIWVVVFVHSVGRFYPQNQPADLRAGGDWDSVTYIGVPRDRELKFDIIAVLADIAGQAALKRYLSEARDKQSWPGLERLPDSVKIYSRIPVTRK